MLLLLLLLCLKIPLPLLQKFFPPVHLVSHLVANASNTLRECLTPFPPSGVGSAHNLTESYYIGVCMLIQLVFMYIVVFF